MRQFTVNLREKETKYKFMPTLHIYLLDGDASRPMVIIVPGGGYEKVCTDCEKTAMQYASAGFHTAILNYRTKPHHFPEPQYDLASSIKIIREHAKEWYVCTDKITVCGYSAGAHLCACVATLWNNKNIFPIDDIKNKLHKPNACILYSAVLTTRLEHYKAFLYDHVGTKNRKKLKYAACDLQVNSSTPPTFMLGTYEDKLANVENMLYYAEKLTQYHIPFELHILPKGNHCAPWCDETIWAKKITKRNYNPVNLSIEWLIELYNI